MLIDWLPPALKRFYHVANKSSLPRREQRWARLLTFQVENLEERQLLSAANSYDAAVVDQTSNIDPLLLQIASVGLTAYPFTTAGSGSTTTGNTVTALNPTNGITSALPIPTGTRPTVPTPPTQPAFQAHTGVVTDLASSMVAHDQFGRVGVHITTSNATGLLPSLQALGFAVTGSRPDLNFIEGFIPQSKIGQLGGLSGLGLLGVVPMYAPITHAGPTIDQALPALEADRVLNTMPPGYDGTGVRVGILSDSFNAGGAANLPAMLNGDLPSTVQVLLEGPAGSPNEGRAMAELVHDVAPGAAISFASAAYGQASFAQQIRNLANPAIGRSNIIVDDIGYLDEPYFQDGVISQAVNDVVNFNGVSYFSAAGNQASDSFESINPTFAVDPLFGAGNYLDFDPSSGVNTRNQIFLQGGESIQLGLQWDDPFYTVNGVDTDIDIFILDAFTGEIVASGTSNNIATQTPFEFVGIGVSGINGFGFFEIVVRLDSGPAPGRLKWIDFGQHQDVYQFDTQSSTVWGHPAATGAMAVGASPYYDQNNIEPFSSTGTTTILFTATGSPLGVPDVRQTPDIVAIDGTNTSFFTGDIFANGTDAEGDAFPNFYGTSAAAPHAAAIAALVKQANPGFSPAQIYDRLQSTATDIGAPGVDAQSGYGLVNAYDAVFGAPTPAVDGYSDSFESGTLAGVWETNSQGSGVIKIGSSNGSTDGGKSMTLDSSLSGSDYFELSNLFFDLYSNQNFFSQSPPFYLAPNLLSTFGDQVSGSLNESILHLDLSNTTEDVFLSFASKQSLDPSSQNSLFNSSQEPMSSIFAGSEGSDGVALSTDGGNTWYRLISLTGPQISNSFADHKFNLTEFANNNGIGLGSDVRIKFQQFEALAQAFNFGQGQVFTFFNPNLDFSNNSLVVLTNSITIDNVQVFTSQPPTLTLTAAPLDYPVGSPPVNIDPGAILQDTQTTNFDGGTLTVSITQNGTTSDRIEIQNQALIPNRVPTPNDITLVSNRVLYGGLQIGTFLGGSGGLPLIVSLNTNATAENVQFLLRDITFRTQSPSLLPRTIQVSVDDGTGGGTATDTRQINVIAAANVAPTIALSPVALNVQPGTAATPIDLTATVVDSDSANFAGGVLTVQITNNASTSFDRIEIKHTGNGAGQIGFSGSTIKYGGVTIGTLSGGTTNRAITLTAAATPAAVQALVRNVTFRTISTSAPLATRTVQFKLTDGDGGTSAIASKLINVVKRNQNPRLTGTTTIPTYYLGKNPVVIEPAATVADPDSSNFNGGTLTIRVTANGTAFDRLTIRNQGSNIGQIAVSGGTNILYGGILIGTVTGGNGSNSPLVITFNANANSAAVRALMRNITFQTGGTIPSLKQRTISFALTDGQGGVSNILSKFVKVSRT